jgi:hypothetical protein
MTDVTQLLSVFEQGDPHVASRLLPLVDDELLVGGYPDGRRGAVSATIGDFRRTRTFGLSVP